jgi:hypothetical protein
MVYFDYGQNRETHGYTVGVEQTYLLLTHVGSGLLLWPEGVFPHQVESGHETDERYSPPSWGMERILGYHVS